MRRFLPVLFLLFALQAFSQKQAEPGIEIRTINTKFQFVSPKTSQPVNNELWDEAEPFVNGLSRVLLIDKFSFVNSHGQLISPVVFDNARNFNTQLAAVKKDGKWGFINESGKIIFDFTFDIVFDFESSISVGLENKTWKLISSNGKIITALDITVCFGFKNGKAKIIKDGRAGTMTTSGEINFLDTESPIKKSPRPFPNQQIIATPCPDNIDFEYGNFTNWQCYTGRVDSVGNTNVITVTPSPPIANRHTIFPRVIPSALDPFGLFPTNPPDGSNFAVRLGNTNVGAQAERIRYTIHVPVNDSNFSIVYDYAVVFEDPGHTIWTQPRFISRLLDSATNTYIDCASFEYISTSTLPGFQVSTIDTNVMFKPWASVFYSLRGHGGRTLYLEFTTADCVRRGHWGYAYVDVENTCGSLPQVQYDCTFPNITTLTGPPGFQFYNWWNQNFTTLLGTGQTITLNPGPTVNSVIWLEVIPFNNFGCLDTLKVTITGILNAHFDMSDTSHCGAPKTITFYNRNLPSLTTFWNFGDGTTATGDTVTHTFLLPGTYSVQLNVTVPSGCNGIAIQQVVIYPIPNVVQPPNQLLCNGAMTNLVTFTGSVSGTIFNWTNTNTAIGLASGGTGNIPAFTAINTTNAPISATITVTPSAAGCTGPSQIFMITVNPTPNVVQPPNQILCNGATTNAIAFTGTVSNTAYNWTNNNNSIGLGTSGTGNIPAFTAINTSNTPVIATITVTPFALGCTGPQQLFTFTINPTPNVVQPPNQILCNGATTNAIAFTGTVSNTAYNWTNNNTTIGLAATGTGNIPAFTAINTTNAPISATITVTPSAAGCTGPAQLFMITVNPTPHVVQPPNQVLCNGASTNLISFTGAVSNATFSWTNNNTTIGLAASGNGNISAFTATNTTNAPVTASITVTPSANGCAGPAQLFIITVNPTPNVVQPPDQALCNGTSTNLIAFAGSLNNAAYSWTNSHPSIGLAATGSGNIARFNAINTSQVPVTASITVTAATSLCVGTAKTFTITVYPTPLVFAGNDVNICLGNAIQLFGTGASNYYWSPSDSLSCSTCPSPVSTTTNNIQYHVKGVSSFGCEAFDSIQVTVSKPFQMMISPNDTLCIGESANLIAGGANNYLWSPPLGLNRIDIANPIAKPTITTLYRVIGYDGKNCFTDTDFVKITVGPLPTVNLGADLNVSTGSIINLNPVIQNGPIINWAWAPSTGLSCTNCPSPALTVTDNIYYTLTVINNYGCIGRDIISIFTFCKSAQVFIPNAFTPDGDGVNDKLMVRGKGIFVKTFRIFNRWGELVFEQRNFNPNDIKYAWDGNVRGVPANSDVFVFTADVICDNGVLYTYKGNTTLLK